MCNLVKKAVTKFMVLPIGILFFVVLCGVQNSVAEEYLSLDIFPRNVGVFYQNETQQFRAVGITATGEVDLTNEVDWYIDPAGYPHSAAQDVSNGAVATIDKDGLVTVRSTWGRVVVHACYPKGCGPNSSMALTSTLNLLLSPGFVVTSAVDTTENDGTISADQIIKNGQTATFDLTPTDNSFEALTVDTDCSGGGTLSNDRLQYTTGGIVADCSVTAYFTSKPEVTPSVLGGNGTVDPDFATSVATGQSVGFDLLPDTGYELLIAGVGGSCPSGAISGETYTTGAVTVDCDVIFTYTAQPVVTSSVPSGNGTVTPNVATSVATGQSVGFTLLPDTGYELLIAGVGGSCPSGAISGTTYTTGVVGSDCSVDFTFTSIPTYYTMNVQATASANGAIGGVVSSPLGTIECDTIGTFTDCDEAVLSGGSVTLQAGAGSGSFTGWSNCSTSTESEITITMDSDKTCVATFAP